ncbi:MAG TPA: hypothetical protein ENJ09_12100 [Planctomycetes bacterium]|nr:hypothetical protein [Planctomycetota bacterium]
MAAQISTKARAASSILAASLVALASCHSNNAPSARAPEVQPARSLELGAGPPPTENWLDPDAEAREKAERKAWIAARHRAVPGVDWRAVEAENRRAEIAKRNRIGQAILRGAPVPASPWVERGSENQAGRMYVAALSPDGTTLFAGSAAGGVWRAAPDGTGWTPIGDNLAGGAHHLAVVSGAAPGDPAVVLAATYGGEVHVTRDDGMTWVVPAGLPSLSRVKRVLVSSDGTETCYLVGRTSGKTKLWRSTDGLLSFQLVRTFGSFEGDIWTPRTGSGDLYFLGTAKLDVSTDHGDTWTTVGPGPGGSSAELVGCEAGAPRLWAVFHRNNAEELHRSDDGGASFTFLRNLSDYWETLNASITDPDLFAYGGVEAWRTTDGGASFSKINSWGSYYGNPANRLHADIQGMVVLPTGPVGETWYVGTDGGLYRSQDRLGSVKNTSLSGLRVSQYYSTLTSAANPLHVIAGAQDQGYQWASTPPNANSTRIDFDQLISGDYGHLTSRDGTHAWVFCTYPGFILAQRGEDSPSLYQVSFPSGEQNAWLPPVVASNIDRKNFFFLATRLWNYQKNSGSNSWTSQIWSTQNFQGSSGEYLTGFTFSPVDTQRAYAVTNRGRLFYSGDRGKTWTESASTGPNAHYFYGTALIASRLDADTVWVGGSGYGVPAVYRSTDGGQTFQAWGDGLPSTLVYCLAEAPDGSGVVFAGTELAAWKRGPNDAAWVDITGADAPATTYWSVEALPNENTMRFGTYGRGIWDYQIDPVARCTVQNGSGTNRVCFTCTSTPTLGSSWQVQVDASGHAGATFSGFVIYDRPSLGTTWNGSEVLVDLSGQKLYQVLAVSSGGLDSFSIPLPSDPSLAGLLSYAQGFVLGGTGELCNSLEIVLGN